MSKKYSSDKGLQNLFEGFRSYTNEGVVDSIKGAFGMGGEEAPAEPAAPADPIKTDLGSIMRNGYGLPPKVKESLVQAVGAKIPNNYSTIRITVPLYNIGMTDQGGNKVYYQNSNIVLSLGNGSKVQERHQINNDHVGQMSGEMSVNGMVTALINRDKAYNMVKSIKDGYMRVVQAKVSALLPEFAQQNNLEIAQDSSDKYAIAEIAKMIMLNKEIGTKVMVNDSLAMPSRKMGWATHNVDEGEFAQQLTSLIQNLAKIQFNPKM